MDIKLARIQKQTSEEAIRVTQHAQKEMDEEDITSLYLLHNTLEPLVAKFQLAIEQQVGFASCGDSAVMLHDEVVQARGSDIEGVQVLDLSILWLTLAYLVKRNLQLRQKAQLTMWSCHIIDGTQTVLLRDVFCLYARLLTYLASHGAKGVRQINHIQATLKEATDDVIASHIDIDALTFIKQDMTIAGLNDGADTECITKL